MLNIYKVV